MPKIATAGRIYFDVKGALYCRNCIPELWWGIGNFIIQSHLGMKETAQLGLDIYINYPGHCQQAFKFYEEELGAKLISMMHHQSIPAHFPADWKNPVLHGVIEIGGTLIRGADVPGADPMRSCYLTLRLRSEADAERIYALLAKGGEIFMKMEKMFFANRFAMLRDRFGTSWMIMQIDE